MSRYAVQIVGPAGRVTWLMDDGREGTQDEAVVTASEVLADLAAIGYQKLNPSIITQAVDLDAEPRDA